MSERRVCRQHMLCVASLTAAIVVAGCGSVSSDATSDDAGLVSQLAAKAAGIADNIGGENGFGEWAMADYGARR